MKRFLFGLVSLLILASFAFLASLNSIVAAAVEKAGTHALGVETTLDKAKIGLLGSDAQLNGLVIDNPEGFGESPFLSLDRMAFDLSAPSLFGEVISIPLIELEGPRLSVIQNGTSSNVATILSRLDSGGGDDPEPEPSTEEETAPKRFIIERIVLKQVEVEVSLDLLGNGSNATSATLVIPEVLVQDVGSEGDGAPLEDVVGQVVKALLAATLDADGGSILDGTLRKTIEDGLGGLKEKGQDVIDQAREKVDQTLGDVEGQADDAVKEAKEKLKDRAGDLFGGLGGKKDSR